jgi:uncharacterized protein YfaS (alpha-2-macroglobulin family)
MSTDNPQQNKFQKIRRILGTFSYVPPEWLRRSLEKESASARIIKNKFSRFKVWKSQHQKAVNLSVVALLSALVGFIAWHGYHHWIPHPDWITVTVEAPRPMNPYDNEAKPNPVQFLFSAAVAPLDKVGLKLEKGPSLSPKLEGQWFWQNDRSLIFTPQIEWVPGEDFTATFKKEMFVKEAVLASYSIDFQSTKFSMSGAHKEYYQHPHISQEKKGVFSLYFTHPVDPQSLSQSVELNLVSEKGKAKKMKFTIEYAQKQTIANVHSEFLTIPDTDSTLKLEISKGVKSALGGNTTQDNILEIVNVPGMFNYFKVDSIETQVVRNQAFEDEQVLIVKTSTGARSSELLKKLQLFLLPAKNPNIENSKNAIDYWQSPGEVTPEILKVATKINLELIPSEFENSTVHSFRIQAEKGRFLYAKIEKGLKSFGEYILSGDFEKVLKAPLLPREVLIMHNGSILSLKGDKKIPILTRNVGHIQLSAKRLRPQELHHLISQTEGSFKNPYFKNEWSFSEENITELFTEERSLFNADPSKTEYTSFDFSNYLNQSTSGIQGVFFFKATEWDPVNKVSKGQASEKFIVVTDLGLILKQGVDRDLRVYVQSFSTGLPVAGAKVEILAKNGTSILSEVSDSHGRASFPSLADFKNEKTPIAVIVKLGDDYTFLPLAKSERSLNLARFDVGGLESTSDADQMMSFLFSDRGIFRPGDTAHFGSITKSVSWKPYPEGIPLEFVVVGPQGAELFQERFKLSSHGLNDFEFSIEENSPTGTYQAQVHFVRDNRRAEMLGSTKFKVEEFQPDRMKILATLSKQNDKGWVKADDLKLKVLLTNMFGTPAQNRKIDVLVNLRPGFPQIRAFQDFVFLDALQTEKYSNEKLESQKTNTSGEAEFDIDLKKFIPASYQLVVEVMGYEGEEGGRSVTAANAIYVSPLEYVVGFKPDGDLSYLKMGQVRKVSLIALNPELKKVAVKKLKTQLTENRYVSVLTQQSNGTYKYQSIVKEVPVGGESPIEISEKGAELNLDTSQGGNFILNIKDEKGLYFAKIKYSVMGASGLARGLERNAELQVALDKTDYQPGDEIELQIKAPYQGAGLLTIEREKVFSSSWFKTNSETTLQRIKIPEGVEGNAYVSITFLRALDSKEIYTSPMSYAVAPFTVSKARRNNPLTLKVPEVIRPGDKVKIKYGAAKPTSFILYGVDEGILQVAGYKMPDPLSFFFAKRALQVSTFQILDLLLPEYSVFQSLSTSGGDEDGLAALGSNLNPFKRKRNKPVAFWSGILSASEKENSFEYEVPDYFNGSLKVMAVASSSSSVGRESVSSWVRGDFVVNPNVPTFVAPGDEFSVSVQVSNTSVGSGEAKGIQLSLSTSDAMEILGENKKTLDIKEGSEKSETFKVKAKDKLGSAEFKFDVEWNSKKAKSVVDLSIRPLTPYRTDIRMGLMNDSVLKLPVNRKLYKEFENLNVGASLLPLGLAQGFLSYLGEYPYGCTEQVVSQGFPNLLLVDRKEMNITRDSVAKKHKNIIRALRSRQTSLGGFGLWGSQSEAFDFTTLYALHYLTEAKARGWTEGVDLLDRGLGYLLSRAFDKVNSLHEARLWAYALYILARNAKVSKESLDSLRANLESKYKKEWRQDLTAAYVASIMMLYKNETEARSLMKDFQVQSQGLLSLDHFYDGAIRGSQYIYLIGLHFPDLMGQIKAETLMTVLEPVMKGFVTTINSSYVVMALDAYVKASGEQNLTPANSLKVFEKINSDEKALVLAGELFLKSKFNSNAQEIVFKKSGDRAFFYQLVEAGFDKVAPKEELKQKIEISRAFLDASKNELTKVKNGEEIYVRLRARSLDSSTTFANIAIVDLLPGGFEVVLDSVRKHEPQSSADPAEGEGESYEGDYQEGPEDGYTEEGSLNLESIFQSLPQMLPGLKPNQAWAQVQTSTGAPMNLFQSTFLAKSVDVREDRVVVFGSLSGDSTEYYYKIKAINAGTYQVPPPFAEAMYDKTIVFRGVSSQIEVSP